MKTQEPTYLSFQVGKEKYAVSTHRVLEVLELENITPVPNALDFIQGIITFRGNIIPVVCLHQKLGLAVTGNSEKTIVIVFDTLLKQRRAIIAAIVDSVHGVLAAAERDIVPLTHSNLRFDKDYCAGVINHNNTYTLVLNINQIF